MRSILGVRASALALVMLALAAGCVGAKPAAIGSPSGVTTGPDITLLKTPTTSAFATTSLPALASSSNPIATVVSPSSPYCRIADLTVTRGVYDAGLGHESITVVFRDTGPRSCLITGYPGVAGLDSSGHQSVQATRTPSGYLGGIRRSSGPPPVIHLVPKQTAAALIEGTSVGEPANCGSYHSLLVTPPGETHSVPIAASLPACSGLRVHPILLGTTGTD